MYEVGTKIFETLEEAKAYQRINGGIIKEYSSK